MQDVHFARGCSNMSADLPEADACALHSDIRQHLLECPVACCVLYPGPTPTRLTQPVLRVSWVCLRIELLLLGWARVQGRHGFRWAATTVWAVLAAQVGAWVCVCGWGVICKPSSCRWLLAAATTNVGQLALGQLAEAEVGVLLRIRQAAPCYSCLAMVVCRVQGAGG